MPDTLLIIDPQNDFCDLANSALPVPGSASDMQRAADFIDRARDRIGDIVITLDSHPTVAIERPTFWAFRRKTEKFFERAVATGAQVKTAADTL